MSEKKEVLPPIKSKRQRHFIEQRKDWSDREIQLEQSFYQQILIDKTEKVRGNTNTMIWWLIAIPLVIGIIAISGTTLI